MRVRHEFMWGTMVSLGFNMWCEVGNMRGLEFGQDPASDELVFDRAAWDAYLLQLKEHGVNTIVLDIGEALKFESHPELAVKGSWSREEMLAELDRMNEMGFEVIPKLNFSTTHDIWMKEYSFMVSTPAYYQVCKDLIDEVIEIFQPRFFHLGMDEEGYECQKNYDYVVIRQNDLWWHDLYYLVDCVEKHNVRAMMWSDYARHRPDEFVAKCPKSVVQCVWYYFNEYGDDIEEMYRIRVMPLEVLDQHGFDQFPTGSSIYFGDNLDLLTRYCKEHVSKEHLLGMMQTTWRQVLPKWEKELLAGSESVQRSREWYENQ